MVLSAIAWALPSIIMDNDKNNVQAMQGIFSRLASMINTWCWFVHGRRMKSAPRPAGLFAGTDVRDVLLCGECSRHLILAAAKRAGCRQGRKIACSACPEPCTSPEHRAFMKRVMLLRVLWLIVTCQFGVIMDHFKKAPASTKGVRP